MSSLLPWVVVLLLVGALGLQQWLHSRETTKWMRLLSYDKHIPLHVMEGSDVPDAPGQPVAKRERKRISFAVPGGALFRKPDAHDKR